MRALLLVLVTCPAAATAQGMPGMAMPSPTSHAQEEAGPTRDHADDPASPDQSPAEDSGHIHAPGLELPTGHPMAEMAPMAMPDMMIGGGAYSGGSGTSRLPASEGPMTGPMLHSGDWMLMAHGYLWGIETHQASPRGDTEAFVQSMAMLEAYRPLGDRWRLGLRGMFSLEPLMGQRGYPNLFATGETAHGRPLVDRQHPHDLFMELSARVDYDLGGDRSLFVYGGPVAEPALGPSAFMHRNSARFLPLSPITHHWFDSTHITYGVVTAGYATPMFQFEGSGFRGREPDEHRWDIERPAIDSWSLRASWTPNSHWAAQISHGRLKSPEAQHPGEDEARTNASVNYAIGGLATTFAFSAKNRLPGRTLTAWLGEANWDMDRHNAVFGRIENVANDELFPDETDPLHDRKFRVTRFEGGYARKLRLTGQVNLALGGSLAAYAKPDALDAAYGDKPVSWTLFAKLSLGQ